MSVNPHRGEVSMCLSDQCYVLRPTFQALCSIEQVLGMSLVSLIMQMPDRGLTLDEMVEIIHAGMKAGENPHIIPKAELGEHIMQASIDYCYTIVTSFLIKGMGVKNEE